MLCKSQESGYLSVKDEPRVCAIRRAFNIVDAALPDDDPRWNRDAYGLIAAVYAELRAEARYAAELEADLEMSNTEMALFNARETAIRGGSIWKFWTWGR